MIESLKSTELETEKAKPTSKQRPGELWGIHHKQTPLPCERGRGVALGKGHFLPPPAAVASDFFLSSAAGWVVSQSQPYIRVCG